MDLGKLVNTIRGLGFLIVPGALIWWYLYFEGLLSDSDTKLIEALPCLVHSSGGCGILRGLVSLGGGVPYNPISFWVGAAIVIVGIVLSLSLKK